MIFGIDNSDIISGLVVEFIAVFLLFTGTAITRVSYKLFARRNPLTARLTIVFGGTITLVASFFLLKQSPAIAFASAAIVIAILFWRLYSFWKLGISSIDSSVTRGIDYARALRLCSSSLDFLGIGAHKLTSLPEFEQAVRRCATPSAPVRMLLLSPDDPHLVDASLQAGRSAVEYKRRVQESIRNLINLKEDKRLNIEVRYYDTYPIWRMMFVNDAFCLLSYNVLGTGSEGRSEPQLHISRFVATDQTKTFYWPHKQYFEQLWNSALPVEGHQSS